MTHPAHRRVAFDVIPEHAHRLHERPGLASTPLHFVAAEILTQLPARPIPEQMPSTHEIQGMIGGPQSTHIDDPGQAVTGDKNVAGNQVAMCHPIR